MIGVFDSGVGGLTVLKHIHLRLPEYGTLYLGDAKNAPYVVRSHDEIEELTWRGVEWLFHQGCSLVILACNSASAQALREIQQKRLKDYPEKRVLGIIIPTAEELVDAGVQHIGVLGTDATISSHAYEREFEKYNPVTEVISHSCPQWAPMIERGEVDTPTMREVVKHDLDTLLAKDGDIEAILLACTHYPVLIDQIEALLPRKIHVFDQGPMVARRLELYLQRHPEIDERLHKQGERRYVTTGSVAEAENISRRIGIENVTFSSVDLEAK